MSFFIVPQNGVYTTHIPQQVQSKLVRRIISHRLVLSNFQNEEEYLVEWKRKAASSPCVYSWHSITQLERCLGKIQKYLVHLRDRRSRSELLKQELKSQDSPDSTQSASILREKAGLETADDVIVITSSSEDERQEAEADRVRDDDMVFNGALDYSDGFITAQPFAVNDNPVKLPNAVMNANALSYHNTTSVAEYAIEMAFRRSLSHIPGPPVTLGPTSALAPPLDFAFISENIYGEGVEPPDPDILVGCGNRKEGNVSCRPNMGGSVGCEYSRVCECLEDAPIDEARLTPAQQELMAQGELMGLPKRFPYTNPHGRSPNCLTSFYLGKRNTIYECNDNCLCGPDCKTRVVQHGRTIPLQIFHAGDRGWGLRSPVALRRGQFIDTYRGEIITCAEADRRQEGAAGKPCYLYDLDKNVLEEDGTTTRNDYYVVDGEHVGGPTRFMNHSCSPNCLQYCVSNNKNDTKLFQLAFFALRDIPAHEELTFDYLDKDIDEDEENSDEIPEDSDPCLCGSENCRGRLWG